MTAKKNVKLAKEEIIGVRCTSEQKEMLEAVAARDGLGVSTWLLHMGLRIVQERKGSS